jgi:beta-N-acetylhexosaminidase
MALALSVLCGQLLVVGLSGAALSDAERRLLAANLRGGVVLFKRNVLGGVEATAELTRAVAAAAGDDLPPLVAVDQEGGRVARIGSPALVLPPMRRVGDRDDPALAARLAEAQARELAALGFTMSFAPVLDIHTRDANPVIGDRAFGTTAERVAKIAGAWADGLAKGGVLSCGKHFPGHGDTTVDSHHALPHVDRSAEDLRRVEIAPFRALARRLPALMTAHVVYPALDDGPATLSHAICTDLLRRELGFEGVLFSDDLEMKAIALPAAEAAVRAIAAGCDTLLVCSRGDLAEEAHAALVREAEKSAAFRTRCEEACARSLAMRRRVRPAPVADLGGVFGRAEATAAVAELAS